MLYYTDQIDRSVELTQAPKRIVSLVPSQTELLFDLGLDQEVVGITKFCIHPENWFRKKTRIGGTKQLNIQKVREIQPDLIIANKEENVREQIEELQGEFPIWTSDVNNLQDAIEMIQSIGEITERLARAKEIADGIRTSFSMLKVSDQRLRVCYLIWKDPYMTIGGDTFINDLLKYAGFQNIFEERIRYPQISAEELQENKCDLLLLSSEPFPFKQRHIDQLQTLLPDTAIMLVDGEMFSWYGSRLLKVPSYFNQLQNQVLSLKHG